MWNVDIFDRWVFIWGTSGALKPGFAGCKTRVTARIIDWLRNRIRLSPYHLGRNDLQLLLTRIGVSRPAAIYSYSNAAYLLALEAEASGFQCSMLKAVVLTAEPVRPHMVKTVETAFGVPAVIEYGSIECGFLAGLWPDHSLRVREDMVLLETIPRRDRGYDVIVTVLGNRSFPLIRYAIGDISEQPLKRHEKGFATLHSVSGRDHDIIVTKSGALLHGQIFEDILDQYDGIRRWRVIQKADGKIRVQLECDQIVQRKTVNALEKQFNDLVGGFEATLELTENIPPSSSGKYRAITSDLRAVDLEAG